MRPRAARSAREAGDAEAERHSRTYTEKKKDQQKMVTIRLTRMGSKKRPFFRVVVCEQRSARDGRFVENIGYYNPRKSPEQLEIQRDRLAYWISKGAKPSNTLRTLVARQPVPPAADAPAAEASAS